MDELRSAAVAEGDLEFDLDDSIADAWLTPEAVHSILVNLVENARKYAPTWPSRDGSEPIQVRTHTVKGRVALDVCDRGPASPRPSAPRSLMRSIASATSAPARPREPVSVCTSSRCRPERSRRGFRSCRARAADRRSGCRSRQPNGAAPDRAPRRCVAERSRPPRRPCDSSVRRPCDSSVRRPCDSSVRRP